MLRITPNKRAVASLASTASTTGSTKSKEKRARNNCVETEIMMWLVLEGWRSQRRRYWILSDSLPGAPDAEAKRFHVTVPSRKQPLQKICLSFFISGFYIWKFLFHVLLKPSLKDFDHYFASMWNECNCTVVWTFFGIALLWDWNENWPFPVCGHCWVFQICWHIECSTFTASYFRVWHSSVGIPSLPIALFIVMVPKASFTWLHTPGCLALGEWSHHYGYSGHCIFFV